MDMDLPYTTVDECIAGEIAKKLPAKVKCSDVDCTTEADIAWIWNSTVFVIKEGRMFSRPATMWFPMCANHAPIQEVPDDEPAEAPKLIEEAVR